MEGTLMHTNLGTMPAAAKPRTPAVKAVTPAVKPLPALAQGTRLKEYRSEIEQFRLLDRLSGVCHSFKLRSGNPIVQEHKYIQPGNTLCKYTFERDEVEYEMVLTCRDNGPALLFSWRKTNGRSSWRSIAFLHRRNGNHEGWTAKHALAFKASTVNQSDFKRWFIYLFSGFDDSLKPLANNRPPGGAWLDGAYTG
jgi:hypothetical protein